ncbi:MAG: nucleotide exchange factor GrpE [Arcanobacterium sp.]|nr:nucleotide exchange factor GrpE [Arcanobacterium sp.]
MTEANFEEANFAETAGNENYSETHRERSEGEATAPGESFPTENPENNSAATESISETGAESDEVSGVEAESKIDEFSPLDQALLQVAELQEQLARRNADYFNLQQEYNGYVKRSKSEIVNQYEAGIAKVLESLFGVLDNAALARAHNDLSGPAGKIVEELEQTLLTNFQLERFGNEGDAFDPQVHEALMHQTSADVTEDRIAQLIQAGYKQGEKILRPARVGVVSPE